LTYNLLKLGLLSIYYCKTARKLGQGWYLRLSTTLLRHLKSFCAINVKGTAGFLFFKEKKRIMVFCDMYSKLGWISRLTRKVFSTLPAGAQTGWAVPETGEAGVLP
jgi:hypothetical protein